MFVSIFSSQFSHLSNFGSIEGWSIGYVAFATTVAGAFATSSVGLGRGLRGFPSGSPGDRVGVGHHYFPSIEVIAHACLGSLMGGNFGLWIGYRRLPERPQVIVGMMGWSRTGLWRHSMCTGGYPRFHWSGLWAHQMHPVDCFGDSDATAAACSSFGYTDVADWSVLGHLDYCYSSGPVGIVATKTAFESSRASSMPFVSDWHSGSYDSDFDYFDLGCQDRLVDPFMQQVQIDWDHSYLKPLPTSFHLVDCKL